jgi:hypothetical protein
MNNSHQRDSYDQIRVSRPELFFNRLNSSYVIVFDSQSVAEAESQAEEWLVG